MVQAVLHGILLSKNDGIAIPDSILSGDSSKSTAQALKETDVEKE